MKLFNHVTIKVKNLSVSKKFYDTLMNVLNYKIVLEIEDKVVGYGTSTYDMFEIQQKSPESLLSKSVHIAFNAASKSAVEEFYSTALEAGAKSNGAPGYRPQYEEGYFAAFIIDPDGHNIEAVFNEK